MDQLKVFWAGVVKYHFWILTTIVLLASLAAFYVSRTDVDQKIESRISKLDNDFRAVTTLKASASDHPNPLSDLKMDEMLTDVTTNVKEAWIKQYERQKPILKWNRKAIASDEAHAKLDSYRPIELHLSYPLPPDKELPVTYRDGYRNYIKDVFPDLARIIGAHWTAQLGTATRVASGSGGDTAGVDGESAGSNAVVIWSQSSQSALQSEMIPWYNPFSSPSTLDICYTQEDIWILEGILKVFKETNGKARENFQAPIKEVEWIKIGRAAGGGASSGVSAGGEGGMPGGDMSAGIGGGSARPDPANNRYVDSNYNPVPASTLRQAMGSSNPEDAFFAVAKRVPVRFRLKMDQSKIAKLLAECGNADLMIEVKQVRINAFGEGGISVGSGMDMGGGAEGGAMNPGSGGAEGGGGGFGGGGVYGGAGEAHISTVVANDPPVEVYGIVYLFNPVDLNKLGLEKVTENTTLVTAAGEAPAAPPPAPTDALPSDVPVTPDAPVEAP